VCGCLCVCVCVYVSLCVCVCVCPCLGLHREWAGRQRAVAGERTCACRLSVCRRQQCVAVAVAVGSAGRYLRGMGASSISSAQDPRAARGSVVVVESSARARRRGLPTLVSQEVSQGHLLHLLVLGRCAVCQPWLPHFEAVQSGAKKPPHRTLPALSPGSVPMIAVCRQRAANFRALSECV